MYPELEKVLDSKRLKEIFDVNPQLLEQVLLIFSNQFTSRMENLSDCLKKKNRKEAELILHTLKSSAAQIGAQVLSTQCEEFETDVYGCSDEYAAEQTARMFQSAEPILEAIKVSFPK